MIKKRLRTTWTALTQQIASEKQKREEFLTKLAKEASNDADHEKTIKEIKMKGKSKRQFWRIRTTLNRLKLGRLAGVDVPILAKNGKLRGWKSVKEPGELHKVVANQNQTHLHQVAPTPLGHGTGYDLFGHKTAKKVLNRELDWQHPHEGG